MGIKELPTTIEEKLDKLAAGQAELLRLVREIAAATHGNLQGAAPQSLARTAMAEPDEPTAGPEQLFQVLEYTDFPAVLDTQTGKFSFKIHNPNSTGVAVKITILGLTKDRNPTSLTFTVNNGDGIRLNQNEEKEIPVAISVADDYGRVSPADIEMENVKISTTMMPLPGDTAHRNTKDEFTQPMSMNAGVEIMHAVRAPFDGETLVFDIPLDSFGQLAGLTFPPDKNPDLREAAGKFTFCSREKIDPAAFKLNENVTIERTLVGYNARNVPVTIKLSLEVTPYFSLRAFVEKFISDLLKNSKIMRLEPMFGFEIRTAINIFERKVFEATDEHSGPSLEDIVKALARNLLEPIGMMLIRDYASRWVEMRPGDFPDRKGYEEIDRVIREKLAILNKFQDGELDFFMPDLDADIAERTTGAAIARGNMRARTIRRDDNRAESYVFWCIKPGTCTKDRQRMHEYAEVVAW